MRFSIIDLGTNSAKLDIIETRTPFYFEKIHREKLMFHLGNDAFTSGVLTKPNENKVISTLQSFYQTSKEHQVDFIHAYATSTFRSIRNQKAVLKNILSQCKIKVRVLSGKQEAFFIANGILYFENNLMRRFALIDIGGGSTEVSFIQNSAIQHAFSLPLGVSRLYHLFYLGDEACADKKAKAYIQSVLNKHCKPKAFFNKFNTAYGSSGTIRNIERMLKNKRRQPKLSAKKVNELYGHVALLPKKQMFKLSNIDSQRIHLIKPGVLLFNEILRHFRFKNFKTTKYSLRDGLIAHEIAKRSPVYKETLTNEDVKKIIQYAQDQKTYTKHEKLVLNTFNILFSNLHPIHGLKKRWFMLGQMACILHDVGKTIDHNKHELHSEHIIKHAHLPFLRPYDQHIISQLAKEHKMGQSILENAKTTFTKEDVKPFLVTLGLLRIADGLNRNPQTPITIKKINHNSSTIRLITSKGDAINIMRARFKSLLLEKVFRRTIIIESATK